MGLGLVTPGFYFFQTDSKMDLLYDTDTLGNGLYMPELEDPEHCNAANTALYELHLLRVSLWCWYLLVLL